MLSNPALVTVVSDVSTEADTSLVAEVSSTEITEESPSGSSATGLVSARVSSSDLTLQNRSNPADQPNISWRFSPPPPTMSWSWWRWRCSAAWSRAAASCYSSAMLSNPALVTVVLTLQNRSNPADQPNISLRFSPPPHSRTRLTDFNPEFPIEKSRVWDRLGLSDIFF